MTTDQDEHDRRRARADASRPRWRDALFVTVLAIVLLAGLVHYGGELRDDAEPAPSAAAPSRAPEPGDEATAQLESTEPTDPATPPASPAAGTCWDGRETTALSLCGDPDGIPGLEHVFPSFATERAQGRCRPVTDQSGRSYAVVVSYLCRERALGRDVSVVYDQVTDPAQVAAWLRAKVDAGVGARLTELPGAHGGRLLVVDTAKSPARITSTYVKFPFVVSVFAPDGAAAERAWKRVVEMRPPQKVRGERA